MRDLGSSMQVGHSATQFAPLFLSLSVTFFGPVDLELFGVKDGRLDAQHTAFFVIDFGRVAVEASPQPHPFGTLLEIGGNLAFKARVHLALLQTMPVTQKAQYAGIWEVFSRVVGEWGR